MVVGRVVVWAPCEEVVRRAGVSSGAGRCVACTCYRGLEQPPACLFDGSMADIRMNQETLLQSLNEAPGVFSRRHHVGAVFRSPSLPSVCAAFEAGLACIYI